MYDVVVIGGGVIGCATARELRRWQLKVVVCERGNDVGIGTSKANSAIIHSGHSARPGTEMARLNVAGNKLFPRLCEELDIPFQPCGSLTIAFDDEELTTLQSVYQDGLLNEVPDMQMLDSKELRQQEPNLSQQAIAGLWAPSAGIICPYALSVGLAENAAINGAEFQLETKVERVTRAKDGWMVHTNKGDLPTKTVLNAAGLYSDVFNNQVSNNKLKIIPRRGEYWLLDKSYAGTFKSTIFQVPGKMGKGVLISPTVDGTIIVGPTADDIDDPDNVETTAAGQENLYQAARRIWPRLTRRAQINSFAGNRSHLTQADFVLGQPADAPGFFNAAGIESPGLTAAPAIAQELAEAIIERLGAIPNTSFQPTRPPVRRFRFMTMPERREAIASDHDFGRIICRCEQVTEAEVRDCIRRPLGARSVDGVKRRTRAGMGRCQGGFCLPRVISILSEELGVSPLQIPKSSGHSPILTDLFGGFSEEGQVHK